MNHLQKFTSQVRDQLLIILFLNNSIILGTWWICTQVLNLDGLSLWLTLCIVPTLFLCAAPFLWAGKIVRPTKLLWQAVLHISPEANDVSAPILGKQRMGKELVSSLISRIYQLASVADDITSLAKTESANPEHNFVANSLPLPLIILNKENEIVFVNQAMCKYIGQDKADIQNKSVYSVLDMAFGNEHTFDTWLRDAQKNKAIATQTWERVRLNQNTDSNEDTVPSQFDLAAYYNQDNPDGLETMLVMFDHTSQYSQDDQAMSFVAIAVHELRTPLTLLRGYIEAFQEELGGKLDPELDGFMKKMAVASQQLAAFVNTILNVSRIENDQLSLKLREEKWPSILESAVTDMRLRAEVRGITLELDIAKDLPLVGVDRVSIYEVITNLIDNAIKYSGSSKKILVKSYRNREGRVETAIQDYGVGIPAGAVGSLFNKFYRNHRNRAQIGGTGLGLYLSKAIVTAQGGQIWVRSKENEGSIFGFTVLPYTQIADQDKSNGDADIVRTAHGWIKNHSLYRR